MKTMGTIQRVMSALLGALLLAASFAYSQPVAAAQAEPALGTVAAKPGSPGSIAVQGRGFTPGGVVRVTITTVPRPIGTEVIRTLQTTTATDKGTIDVVFPSISLAYRCDDSDAIRALDVTTGQWTKAVHLGCTLATPAA